MHLTVSSLSSLTTQVQSWACCVDVYFGDCCSSNVSSKVNSRSGQLLICAGGFHSGCLEPWEPNLPWLLYRS